MKDKKNKNFMNNNFNNQIWIILGVTIFIYLSFSFFASKPITIDYNRFQKMIKELIIQAKKSQLKHNMPGINNLIQKLM